MRCFWLEDIEMGAFDCGLSLGEGTGILDFCHLSQYHFWNFGMNSTMALFNVFYDGQTIAMRCGEVDGLDARGINSFAGRIVFTAESVRGWFYITNLALDGAQATMEVANAFFLLITNMYSTSDNTGTRPRITVNNGKVQIVNYFGYTSSLFPLVYVTGGELTMSDVYMIHYTTTVPAVSVTGGGDLRLYGGRIFPGGVAWTVPLVQQASGGALQMNNMDLTGQAGSTGVAVSFATDVAGNSLGRDIKIPTGWTVTIPASPYNGTYSTLVGVLVGGPTVGVEVNLALSSAINIQREISFMTAASLRWRMVVEFQHRSGSGRRR